MHRMAILAVAAGLLILLVAIQLALPPLIARRAESQLTKHGGHAHVTLKALPSPRLLFKEGDSLKVRATGLVTPPPDPPRPGVDNGNGSLKDLDGFDSVDIQVVGMRAGPLTIARLTLERDQPDEPYQARVQATATGADLATFAGNQLGGGIGGFLGGLAGSAMPGATTEIPIDVGASIRSDGQATGVTGSVAGVPAGPLITALTAALAARF
jgi:hypothetical protein